MSTDNMQLPADPFELPAGPFEVPVADDGLPIPWLRVWLAGDAPPYNVQIYGCDIVLFEETTAKHRWERMGMKEAGVRFNYFLAWAASRRQGLIPQDLTWEIFKTTTKFVKDVDTADTARPTPPGPGPG